MLTPNLCDCGNAYVFVKATITIAPVPPPTVKHINNDKEVTFKNWALFSDCISEINKTQIDNAK